MRGVLYDWMEINQVKNVSKAKHGEIHPCQMPVDVMRRVVGVIPSDYVIVDPFMGSGTTAIACIKEKRHFVGFELNKEYYDRAVKRIKDTTITILNPFNPCSEKNAIRQ